MKASLNIPEVELGIVSLIAFGCFGSNAYISCDSHPEVLSLCHKGSPNIVMLSTENLVHNYLMSQDTVFHAMVLVVVRLRHKKVADTY
jgi:hypothetical protein